MSQFILDIPIKVEYALAKRSYKNAEAAYEDGQLVCWEPRQCERARTNPPTLTTTFQFTLRRYARCRRRYALTKAIPSTDHIANVVGSGACSMVAP